MKLPHIRIPQRKLYFSEFQKTKDNPIKMQLKVLKAILRENRSTVYGSRFGFSHITSYEDYAATVPVVTYKDIESEILRLASGEQKVLTKKKVVFFATTSGTTSSPKWIPVTKERIRQLRNELVLWSTFILQHFPKALSGKLLYFAGPYDEGKTPGGLPKGSISGYLAKHTPYFAKTRLVVPAKLYNEPDFDEKMNKIALLAIRSNITQVGFAAPIEAIQFFEYVQSNREKLLVQLVKKHPLIAQRLAKLPDFTPRSLWPNLCLMNTLLGDAQLPYISQLRDYVGDDVIIRDPGIYASEGRLTIGLTLSERDGLLVAQENFFEFCKQLSPDTFASPVLIDQLELNERYKVILTTREGLYRYDMGDVVQVVGKVKELPLVRFVSRNNFMNLVGELCSEEVLQEAVVTVAKKYDLHINGFTFIPHTKAKAHRPRYELLIESSPVISQEAAQDIEQYLCQRVLDYGQMRNEFGRLASLVVTPVKAGEYLAFEKSRHGQPKPLRIAKESFKEQFSCEQSLTTI